MISPTEASILIIEDEQIVAIDIQRVLSRFGYKIAGIARSYAEAMDIVNNSSVDCALVDIHLSGTKDGIDTALILKENFNIPSVFITAYPDEVSLKRVKKTSPHGFLIKPLRETELQATLELALYKSSVEKQITRQKQILEATLGAISDAVITTDAELNVTMMNPAAQHLFEKVFVENEGVKLSQIISSDLTKNASGCFEKCSGKGYELGMVLPSGTFVELHIRSSVLNSISNSWDNGAVFIVRDVTEERAAQKAVIEREYQHSKLLDAISECVVFTDLNGKIIYANLQTARLFNTSINDVIGTYEKDWVQNTDEMHLLLSAKNDVRKKGTSEEYRLVICPKNSEPKPVLISAVPMFSDAGKVIGTIAGIKDISENEQAITDLREAEKDFYHLIENAPIAFIRRDMKTNAYVFHNQEFERILGGTADEFKDKLNWLITDSIDPSIRDEVIRKSVEWRNGPLKDILHLTYKMKNLRGEELWTDNYVYADVDEKTGEMKYANQITVDITPIKRAEQIIQQSLEENFQKTVKNLQNLVIRLYRREDGKIAYALREGRLAGDLTTEKISGKSINEIFGDEQADISLPPVLRAFEGVSVLDEIPLPNSNMVLLFSLDPIFVNGEVSEVVGSAIDITRLRQVEKLLHDSTQLFGVLSDIAPIGILISEQIDNQLIPKFANKEFQKITGLTFEQFSDLDSSQSDTFLHPDDRINVAKAVEEWLDNDDRSHLHQIYRFRHPRSGYRWLENFAAKYYEDGGKIITIQTARDITEQKESEDKLRHLASIPEQSDIAIIEINPDSIITYANNSALEQFGKDTHIHKDYKFLENILSVDFDKQHTSELIHGKRFYEMETHKLPDGTYRIFCYDITTEKQAHNELLQALAQERRLNELKTRFVRTVSHEFRTPLTSILMSAEILRHHIDKMNSDQRDKELEKIFKRVVQLEEFMNEFIVQSSVDSLREAYLPVQFGLDEIVNDVRMAVMPSISTRHQNFIVESYEFRNKVYADKAMIVYIIASLVKNASRYSPESSTITLTLATDELNAIIKVSDNGSGIKSSELPELFTPFMRGSNSGYELGSGMGLYIVKEFVELHGGEIDVESSENVGSTFSVYLPITQKN